MNGIDILSATQVTTEDLRQGMIAGFTGYAVPVRPSREMFDFMMRQRGLVREASFVVRAAGRVVAIWLVSLAGQRAYLMASGTDPAYRRQGLSRTLADRCFDMLRSAGVETFHTEVMVGNARAMPLYESLGMGVQRNLVCYDLEKVSGTGDARLERVPWADVAAQAAACRDWPPSWQNDDAAVTRAGDDAVCLALHDARGLAGYAVFFAPNASLAQVAVRQDVRRRGLGRALMRGVVAEGAKRVLNADEADAGFARFMADLGAPPFVRQQERLVRL